MSDNRKAINDYIYGLEYDSNSILALIGDTVTNKDMTEGIPDGDLYYVVERKKCTVEDSFDVSVPTLNKSITYPGALLIADQGLIDGNPNTVGVKRGGVKLTLDLPGMTQNNSADIACADYASVSAAVNGILDDWYTNYPQYTSVPAVMAFTSSMVYDEKEMQLKFGVDVSFLENEIGIDFNAIKNKKKSVYIVRYKQVFYTASVDSIKEPADAFSDDTTVNQLVNAGIGTEKPLVYIGAVAYGREIYVKFESDLQSYELESAVSGSVTADGINVDANIDSKIKEKYDKISCSVIAFGGASEHMKFMFTEKDKVEAFNKVICEGITLSRENPACPITYKSVFLKDNKTAQLHGSTEYVDELVSVYDKGELTINHKGGYVARFYITWKQIKEFDQDGNAVMIDQSWDDNGKDKTIGFQTVIPFGGDVRSINIMAEGYTGLVWDKWFTSFDRNNIPLSPEMSLVVSGTTLNQKAEFKP